MGGRTSSPLLLPLAAALALLASCATLPPARSATDCRAFMGGTVLPAPDAEPLRDATVLECGGVLRAVGPAAEVAIPPGAEVVQAGGGTLAAGFWNAHIHLTGPAFAGAATRPAAALSAALAALGPRWGFVHLVDTGSDPFNSAALKARLRSGEVRGPSLHLAYGPLVAVGGQPRYVPVPLPQLATSEDARREVAFGFDTGADAIKLMTVSVVAHPPPPVMPVEVVRAVTAAAHARGKPVLAHPTTFAGLEAARLGGVDVLAHTAPESGPWTEAQARALVAAGMSLIPTLSLWRLELAQVPGLAARWEADAVEQVRAFRAAGGTLLFGTDAGYRPEYDPAPELALLRQAGLDWRATLAMLTTAPAARFGEAAHTGRLAPGLDADLVLLGGDATADATAFTRVLLAVRQGVVLSDRRP